MIENRSISSDMGDLAGFSWDLAGFSWDLAGFSWI